MNNLLPAACFGMNAGTLKFKSDFGPVLALYDKYREELRALTTTMSEQRAKMMSEGYDAEFSDRDAELLYLLTREGKPETVVEISPRHAYSTNYLLAALTKNGKGHLHTYEITTHTVNKPTEQILIDNLLPNLDRERLSIYIGDATEAKIPNSDFALFDSSHEAWFAAWYLLNVAPRTKMCIADDIVVRQSNGTMIPKSRFLGVRESTHVLSAHSIANRGVMASCLLDEALSSEMLAALPIRNPGISRGLLFRGGDLGERANNASRSLLRVVELQKMAILGLRQEAQDGLREVAMNPAATAYEKLCAYLLIPAMGYLACTRFR